MSFWKRGEKPPLAPRHNITIEKHYQDYKVKESKEKEKETLPLFKWVHFMVCKLHLNKAIFSKRHKSIPSLVQSGFCNEVPRTCWLVSNRNLFLTVLGAH